MYGVVLILVIAVMGGVIAYIGDKLGTKVGKKKLTIFGLRPKHTSILVTIVTGILISASTLGIMAVASQDVRTALFGMEELKARLISLSSEVIAKNQELDTSRAELDKKTQEYTTLMSKISETAAKLKTISAELESVSAERDRTIAALEKLQTDYAAAQENVALLEKTKAELDTKVASLTESKKTLESDVENLKTLTENLRKGIQAVREGVVIYRAGEVLTTATVDGNKPIDETQAALAEILADANRMIINKLGIPDRDMEVLWIAKTEFDDAVKFITANRQDVIVRVSAAGNTIYGEPIIGQIDIFPNRLIYSSGELVYKETFQVRDARLAEESVLVFLQKVNNAATREGIVPDPLQGTVGILSGSQLYDTINKVKKVGGRVELSAIAQNDVYTLGPLRIEIVVKPATS